jgi:DNA-binding transcriptional regulator YiaG
VGSDEVGKEKKGMEAMNTGKVITGVEVKSMRLKLGMTQEDLAHALGVTVSTVNRWENGHTRPSRLAVAGLERLAETRSESGGAEFVPPESVALSVGAASRA